MGGLPAAVRHGLPGLGEALLSDSVTAAGAGDTAQREALLRRATAASVAVAMVLLTAKLWVWLVTGSVSLLASLVDSLMDALASMINLLAVRYSLRPADAEHRFGHGKAEALAGLGQAAFILGSAVFLALQGVERLLRPQPIETPALGIAVMLVSMALTLLLVLYQRRVIARTGSTAIRADALHYSSDLLANSAVILALALSVWGWPAADAVLALLLAVYIAGSAVRIGSSAVELLLDRELPDALRAQIVALAYGPAAVRGVHDLRSWQSGQRSFVQLHLELDDQLSLLEAYAIAAEVAVAIEHAVPGCEVIVHEDPCSTVAAERVVRELRPASASPQD
jgi:ferrous-iron efflux pump FieF